MDKIINNIQALSTTETDLKQLKVLLSKDEATTVISKNVAALDDILMGALDPTAHSMGYAFLLAAKAASPKADLPKFAQIAQRFLLNCSNQIRYVPGKVAIIVRRYKSVMMDAGTPLKAVKPISTAVHRLRLNSESLTPIHADFLQVCLLSKCYNAALPLLEEDVLEVNPEVTGVATRDYLLYFYYGGMVYTGVKNYGKAFNFFKTVISVPASMLSAIMVEGYKKYVLVALLVHGRVPPLPRHTSNVLQRYHKTGFPQYHEFVTAFGTQSTDDVHKCAELNAEVFKNDKNFGLVKQCIQSLYRRNIQRLTKTYVTFSVQDIAKSVKLNDAEHQVVSMIEDQQIFATINQQDGMVSFQENPEEYDTAAVASALDARIQKTIALGQKIRVVDETLGLSPQYLQRTAMQERGRFGEMGEDYEMMTPGKV